MTPTNEDYLAVARAIKKSKIFVDRAEETPLAVLQKDTLITVSAQAVLDGHADLVLGDKGSGKTQLYRLLTEGEPGDLSSGWDPGTSCVGVTQNLRALNLNLADWVPRAAKASEIVAIWEILLCGELVRQAYRVVSSMSRDEAEPLKKFMDQYFNLDHGVYMLKLGPGFGIKRADLPQVLRSATQGVPGLLQHLNSILVQRDLKIWLLCDQLDELESGDWTTVDPDTDSVVAIQQKSAVIASLLSVLTRRTFRLSNIGLKVFLRTDIHEWLRYDHLLFEHGIALANWDAIDVAFLSWDRKQLETMLDLRLNGVSEVRRLLVRIGKSPTAYRPQDDARYLDVLFGLPKERGHRVEALIDSLRTARDKPADDVPPRRLLTVMNYMIQEFDSHWTQQIRNYSDNPATLGLTRSPALPGLFAGPLFRTYSKAPLSRSRRKFLESLHREEPLQARRISAIVDVCGGISRPVAVDLVIEAMASVIDAPDAQEIAKSLLPYMKKIGLISATDPSLVNSPILLAPAYRIHEG